MPYFRFMTGAGFYRIEAASREEAIQFIFDELKPNDNAKAVILQTLYDEDERRKAVIDVAPDPSADADADDANATP